MKNTQRAPHAHTLLVTLGALALTPLALGACNDPADDTPATPALTHSQAHALTEGRINSYSAELDRRFAFLNGNTSLFEALDRVLSFEALSGSEGSSEYECTTFDENGDEIPCPELPEEEYGCVEWDESGNEIPCEDFEEEPEAIEVNLTEGAQEMIADLLSKIPEDLIIEGEAQLTYALNTTDLCTDLSSSEDSEESDGAPTDEYYPQGGYGEPIGPVEPSEPGEPDPACVDFMERQRPRIIIEGTEERLKITARTTAGDLAIATLTERDASASLNLDTLHALITDAAETNTRVHNEEPIDLPTFGGAVSVKLALVGGQGTELSFNIDRPISLSGAFEDMANDLNLNIAASERLIALRADGAASTIGAALNLGRLSASASGVDLRSEEYDEYGEPLPSNTPATPRAIALDLGGVNLDAALDLRDALKVIISAGLGDSTTTLKVDNQQIVRVDVNPTAARRVAFELILTELPEDQSELVMKLTSALMSLNAEWDITSLSEITDFMFPRQDSVRVELTPTAGDARMDMGEQLKVLAGTLTLASGGQTITVEAGQCVVEAEYSEPEAPEAGPVEGEASPLFSGVEAGVCGG